MPAAVLLVLLSPVKQCMHISSGIMQVIPAIHNCSPHCLEYLAAICPSQDSHVFKLSQVIETR